MLIFCCRWNSLEGDLRPQRACSTHLHPKQRRRLTSTGVGVSHQPLFWQLVNPTHQMIQSWATVHATFKWTRMPWIQFSESEFERLNKIGSWLDPATTLHQLRLPDTLKLLRAAQSRHNQQMLSDCFYDGHFICLSCSAFPYERRLSAGDLRIQGAISTQLAYFV